MSSKTVVTRTATINAKGVKLCRVRKDTQQRMNVVTQIARIIREPVPAANVKLIIIWYRPVLNAWSLKCLVVEIAFTGHFLTNFDSKTKQKTTASAVQIQFPNGPNSA
uniref:Uncharacterized protein n=1 Tax=Cacopsylla melanoneura TaxID=428564 RepID=A0A8D8TC83_9HEMI